MGNLRNIFHQRSGKFVFFDTETTDLNPGEIAQLSYVVTDHELGILTAKNFYFAVEKVSSGASRVNGLDEKKLYQLSGGKRFDESCREIHTDFYQQHLVAHNIKFDLRFLEEEFRRRGLSLNNCYCYCTMDYFKPICAINTARGSFKNPRLSELVEYFQITEAELGQFAVEAFGTFEAKFHDSRFDVAALYLICQRATEAGYIKKNIG